MRPVTRRLAAGMLAASPLLVRTARAQTGEGVMARVRRTGIVRFGVVNGQPPYCYKDIASGEWRGFLVDITRDLATELGARIEPVESTWGNAVLDLQSDKVNIFFGLAPSPERAKVVDFTRPMYQNAFSLIARKGFQAKTWQELDDPAVRVALEVGTVYDLNVGQLCPKATISRFKSNNDAMLAVQSNRADCQIIVVIFALTSLTRNPNLGHLVVPEPLFGSTTNAMVAKEADPQWRIFVDAWIDRKRAAGALRRALVENLALVGVKSEDVPPQLLF
jgi:polar amino acid transport system substrate-binding protein